MKTMLIGSSSLIVLAFATQPAFAQTSPQPGTPPSATQQTQTTSQDQGSPAAGNEDIIVTATRRNESLQDVPLSVTAFTQHELTTKGIVGFDGLARETPGVVANKASANFVNLSARGISTNGYSAGLQTTVAIYLDDLPLSTIGNTVTLDPNLYDVERVEFLRGPQGTLFGSGSLSGALRIITKSPELGKFDESALADIGDTPDGSGVRQRYDAMINVPLNSDTLALRVVGYYRHEDGYVDNIGTGVKNANTLVDWGGRAELLWKPTDRFDVKLLASYEDSDPKDAGLTNPLLGKRVRYSTEPDEFSTKLAAYNAVVDYQFGGFKLTSSTTYSYDPGKFYVDLAGTFNTPGTTSLPIPFFLDDDANYKTFVEETRLVSNPGGKLDWVIGGYYLHRELDLNGRELSTPAYLAGLGITGLPADGTFYQFGSDSKSYELAGFGELTYHLTDKLWATGGLRYGTYGTTVKTDPGFNSNYITVAYDSAFFGVPYPFAITPNDSAFTKYPSASKLSWKASLSFKPSPNLTTYATVATGYRTPVYNAQAGSVSLVDPTDIVIPAGAGSDKLTNYEIGAKGHWLGGKLSANLAAYYIDWRNIQVQANRPSDSIQFATNVGDAHSKGLEFEIAARPFRGFSLTVNGSVGDAKVVSLTADEALISGAVKGARLAAPHFQGAITGTYSYELPSGAQGFTSVSLQHVGSFPNQFPNSPGTGLPSPLFDDTDSYDNLDIQSGVNIGKFAFTLYMENVTNSDAVTYIHPENFIFNRYLRLRPRTFGVRVGWESLAVAIGNRRLSRPLAIALALISAAGTLAAAPAPHRPTARIATGSLAGVADGTVEVFRGIPYAAPPVGPLRWHAPEPAPHWQGVRDASHYGDACPQPSDHHEAWARVGATSEDCLFLNVWRPARAGHYPVMVFLHGGGFTYGAAGVPLYDGANLARRGAVIVTLNYRLGLLGFFAHPALTQEDPTGDLGNYGIMDQIAALRWVKHNIAAFGGDAGNVTVFGESAGAGTVQVLMGTPAACGLFERAISESGAGGSVLTPIRGAPNSAEARGEQWATSIGLPNATAAQLRALPVDKIIGRAFPFIDGKIVVASPGSPFLHGTEVKVPLLIGANSDEASLAGNTEGIARLVLGARYDALAKTYAAAEPDKTPQAAATDLIEDTLSVLPSLSIAAMHAANGAPAYDYYFDQVPANRRAGSAGTPHGGELEYLFGNPDEGSTWDDADRNLSRQMGDLWVSFARTGHPATDGVTWANVGTTGPLRYEVLSTPSHAAALSALREQVRKASLNASSSLWAAQYEGR